MKRVERFRSRRARLDSRIGDLPPPIADAELVQGILSQEIDWTLIDSVSLKVPVFNDVVTDEEVTRCLSDLDRAFTRQKYDALFEGVKDTIIDQLLGSLKLSRSDLIEVDRKFIYKDVKGDYREGFASTRKAIREEATNSDRTRRDAYTGKLHDPTEEMEVDHVRSLTRISHQGG